MLLRCQAAQNIPQNPIHQKVFVENENLICGFSFFHFLEMQWT
jgi:hypothetical protein